MHLHLAQPKLMIWGVLILLLCGVIFPVTAGSAWAGWATFPLQMARGTLPRSPSHKLNQPPTTALSGGCWACTLVQMRIWDKWT